MRIKYFILIILWLGFIKLGLAQTTTAKPAPKKQSTHHVVKAKHLTHHHHKSLHHHHHTLASAHTTTTHHPAATATISQSNNTAATTPDTLVANTNTNNDMPETIQQRLVAFTKETIATLRYSHYKMGGTRFDPTHGVYVLDCSHYVDHVLHAVYPQAYSSLVRSTGADAPNSENYYHFFAALPQEPASHWDKVDSVSALQPGDILVIRYQNQQQVPVGGHVMIVMNKPVQDTDAYLVRVADSARAGHSRDTRRHSGIGMGTLLLKADPVSGQPYAYAWKAGSYWKDNVSFAMGRPV